MDVSLVLTIFFSVSSGHPFPHSLHLRDTMLRVCILCHVRWHKHQLQMCSFHFHLCDVHVYWERWQRERSLSSAKFCS